MVFSRLNRQFPLEHHTPTISKTLRVWWHLITSRVRLAIIRRCRGGSRELGDRAEFWSLWVGAPSAGFLWAGARFREGTDILAKMAGVSVPGVNPVLYFSEG